MRFRLKSTCAKEQDNLSARYTLVPAAVLALLIAPNSEHTLISRLWAFSVYLKALSMLPQLRLMQNEKMFEPITAHYVFAIGVARFLGFAFWIVMVYQTGGKFLFLVGYGSLWVLMAFISEIIHTFILADFCYYYVKLSWNLRKLAWNIDLFHRPPVRPHGSLSLPLSFSPVFGLNGRNLI
ncbi:uncharacterized protein LOC127799086 [Diospyros lotus]|uniref:uncharacterized protein LOC127799086 n=1 Tax=Diospyros lotus TaxID=55363 RepID=UPI00225BA19F|nr:uncharacterized protein LOC127799086 [Diospyros lotus]